MKKGEAEKIKLWSFAMLKEMMGQAVKAGVELMVCEQRMQLIALKRGDFVTAAKNSWRSNAQRPGA